MLLLCVTRLYLLLTVFSSASTHLNNMFFVGTCKRSAIAGYPSAYLNTFSGSIFDCSTIQTPFLFAVRVNGPYKSSSHLSQSKIHACFRVGPGRHPLQTDSPKPWKQPRPDHDSFKSHADRATVPYPAAAGQVLFDYS